MEHRAKELPSVNGEVNHCSETGSSGEEVAPLACPLEQKRPGGASFSAVTIVVHKLERQGEAARRRSCENRMDSDICIVGPECTSEQEAQNKGDLQGCGHRDRKSTRLNSSHIPLSRMPSSS